jgi:DNA processing protein
VQSAEDVAETLSPLAAGTHMSAPTADYAAPSTADPDDRSRAAVADLLSMTPVPVDELVRLSGRSPAIVASVLLELELAGRLERHAGGRVSGLNA